MHSKLIGNIFLYKKSAVVLAAVKLGLFHAIEENGILNIELCQKYAWNVEYISLICRYLESEGYLQLSDEGWMLTSELTENLHDLSDICEHEYNIYSNWMLPEQMIATLRSETEERPFDKHGFTKEEQNKYDTIVYGKNLNILALHLSRKLNKEKTIRCLEYGKSNGRMGSLIKKYNPNIHVNKVPMYENDETNNTYDLVLIVNCLHYLTRDKLCRLLEQLKKKLSKDGILYIADMFYYSSNHIFQSTLILDWLTHGGVHLICEYEAKQILEQSGFHKIEHKYIQDIYTDTFLIYR